MSSAVVTFRTATEYEGEELAALRVEAMRESLENVGRFDPQRARERFLAGFSPSYTRHVVAQGAKVGFLVLRNLGSELLLDHLYLHPEHQCKGIGSSVLECVFAEADLQAKSVRVGALKHSRSNAFYISHGFELIEQAEWDNFYVRHPESVA